MRMDRGPIRAICFAMVLAVGVCLAAAAFADQEPVTAVYNLDREIIDGEAQNLQHLIDVAKGHVTTLVVIIDSPGGSATEGVRLYRVIRDSGMHTRCEVRGQASSAAFLVLQACETRVMTKESRLLTHHPYVVVSRPTVISAEQARAIADTLAGLVAVHDAIVAARLEMALKDLQERLANGQDWQMDAAAALKAHAIDAILV